MKASIDPLEKPLWHEGECRLSTARKVVFTIAGICFFIYFFWLTFSSFFLDPSDGFQVLFIVFAPAAVMLAFTWRKELLKDKALIPVWAFAIATFFAVAHVRESNIGNHSKHAGFPFSSDEAIPSYGFILFFCGLVFYDSLSLFKTFFSRMSARSINQKPEQQQSVAPNAGRSDPWHSSRQRPGAGERSAEK